ncbi:MAG: DUF1292 domain-containing protein [Oscillospiraceae bacterium]
MSDENTVQGMPDENYEADILTLEDEAGVEHTFEVVDAADVNDQRYLAVIPYHENPADGLEEEAELLIMKVTEEDGEEVLDLLEDEDELYEVGRVFLERLKDVFEIDVEDEE